MFCNLRDMKRQSTVQNVDSEVHLPVDSQFSASVKVSTSVKFRWPIARPRQTIPAAQTYRNSAGIQRDSQCGQSVTLQFSVNAWADPTALFIECRMTGRSRIGGSMSVTLRSCKAINTVPTRPGHDTDRSKANLDVWVHSYGKAVVEVLPLFNTSRVVPQGKYVGVARALPAIQISHGATVLNENT